MVVHLGVLRRRKAGARGVLRVMGAEGPGRADSQLWGLLVHSRTAYEEGCIVGEKDCGAGNSMVGGREASTQQGEAVRGQAKGIPSRHPEGTY